MWFEELLVALLVQMDQFQLLIQPLGQLFGRHFGGRGPIFFTLFFLKKRKKNGSYHE